MRRYATSSLGPEENTACRWDNLLNYDRYIWSERENADQENCLFDWHFRAFKFGVIHVATSLINDTREWASINTFQFASVRRKLSLNFHLGLDGLRYVSTHEQFISFQHERMVNMCMEMLEKQ